MKKQLLERFLAPMAKANFVGKILGLSIVTTCLVTWADYTWHRSRGVPDYVSAPNAVTTPEEARQQTGVKSPASLSLHAVSNKENASTLAFAPASK